MNLRQKTILFMLCVPLLIYAGAYMVETVPSPKMQGQNYYVSNPDMVLTSQTVQLLNERCARLEEATEVELAVVAVEAFDESRTAYGFSLDLFNHWHIGKADKNTGVLLFLATGSRDIQIITGAGIEGILTDAVCGDILDNNLADLSDGDYNRGIIRICEDIEKELLDDANRAELLLGWRPESTDGIYLTLMYVILGFLCLIWMAVLGYKRLQGQPGQTKKEIQDQSEGVKSTTGCLSVFFPFPMLLFYIYYIIARRRVRSIPPVCKQCGQTMNLLDRDDPRRLLTDIQKKEEELQAREYEIWICPDCGNTQAKQLKGRKYYYFDTCPQCAAYALETTGRTVITKATAYRNGLQRNTYHCAFCGHTYHKDIVLRKESYSSSSGSFGSWGGGSGHSSGSWGGGYSSGGGAGRSF